MRQIYVFLVRFYYLFFVSLLCWCFWVNAQTNTNNVAKIETATGDATVTTTIQRTPEPYLTFGLDKVEQLQSKIFGIPLWQYLASAFYICLAFLISKLLDSIVVVRLKKWAEKTSSKVDDFAILLIQGPIKIVSFVILLHIGLQVFDWPNWMEVWLSKGLKVIVALSITYMLLKLIDLLISQWGNKFAVSSDKAFNDQLFPLISKSIKAFVIIVAALVTSQNLGLNITSVLASLSIGGLALGLAAQDTVANLFGAVAVFVDKPFKIGDLVKIADIQGFVESIGLRSTRIRNLDGHLITVPNKTMGNATITNITLRPNIKTEMNFGITYDTPTEKVRRATMILEEVYKGHPMTSDLIISFNRFADSSLNIIVLHWWGGTDFKAYLAGMQDLNLQIKQRFDSEKIDFAFPTRTLHIKQDSETFSKFPSLTTGNGPAGGSVVES
ncbi:MAG: mechanosensitive ion channel family protein [Verrucomicrobiota bacterium]|nr:mechanosensitive ion channel family protein [Verrucomicrobiota bacterium]